MGRQMPTLPTQFRPPCKGLVWSILAKKQRLAYLPPTSKIYLNMGEMMKVFFYIVFIKVYFLCVLVVPTLFHYFLMYVHI